jgi:hypothetical protein
MSWKDNQEYFLIVFCGITNRQNSKIIAWEDMGFASFRRFNNLQSEQIPCPLLLVLLPQKVLFIFSGLMDPVKLQNQVESCLIE